MSSYAANSNSTNAVNGSWGQELVKNGVSVQLACAVTNGLSTDDWWMVDLGQMYRVIYITVYGKPEIG